MKKLFVLATLVALTTPTFAGDNQEVKEGPKAFQGPKHEMFQKDPEFKAKMEAKKEEMKARKEQMKARDEKLAKLVKEYKGAKEGSKKQIAAREEIGKLLGDMRDEQIEFRANKIGEFEQRLGDMKVRLENEKTAEAKDAWVNKMTDRVIEKGGDLRKALDEHGPKMGKGPKGFKGPKGMKGKHPGFKGGHEDHILPMPPAPREEK